MMQMIVQLHTVLNLIKGFVAGYGSNSNDQMMIDYQGKRYMVTFEELCDSNDEEMFKTMKRYWRQ